MPTSETGTQILEDRKWRCKDGERNNRVSRSVPPQELNRAALFIHLIWRRAEGRAPAPPDWREGFANPLSHLLISKHLLKLRKIPAFV